MRKHRKWIYAALLSICMALFLITVPASAAETKVSTEADLTSALADSSISEIKLKSDIDINNTLTVTVNRIVTLDLNGFVLRMTGQKSVIKVESRGDLTIQDSDPSKPHRFTPNSDGLWVLDETNGTETVSGGVITGGVASEEIGDPFYCGGGVYIADGGKLTMTGGNIVGCTATDYGGGVYTTAGKLTMTGGNIVGCTATDYGGGVYTTAGKLTMTGGNIVGCTAMSGGGIYCNCDGNKSEMSGTALVRDCRAKEDGGGIWINGELSMKNHAAIRGCTAGRGGGVDVRWGSKLSMSDDAMIKGCKAVGDREDYYSAAQGGGIRVGIKASLTMSDKASVIDCSAERSDGLPSSYGGGVGTASATEIILDGDARIDQGRMPNQIGLYIRGDKFGYVNLYANGGSVNGDVILGDSKDCPCTITSTGPGRTVFHGTVNVHSGSTIQNGIFNGTVINNGAITGGLFYRSVNNNGTIDHGSFSGTVNNNGAITGGVFNGTVTNNRAITGGLFFFSVTNNGTITGGRFDGTVTNGASGTTAESVSVSHLKFIVTFDNGCGTTMETVDKGSKLPAPIAPTKEGYLFDGWYYDNNGTQTTWDFDKDTVKSSMTLTAQWAESIPYIVEHYKANGNGYTLEESEHSAGKIGDTATAAPKTYTGFTYNSLISTSSGILKKISSAADTVTLKLYYDRTVYTVTVENDGNGSASAAPVSATMGEEITLTATPDNGYHFKEWQIIAGGVTISNNRFTMPADNVSVKAIFEKKSSGGTSSGGGGGSGSATPTTSTTIPVSGEASTIHIAVTINGTTATISEIDPAELEKVIGTTGIVKIDLSGLNMDIDRVNLPTNSIKAIVKAAEHAHNDAVALAVVFRHGTVTLDDKTMRAIINQTKGSLVRLVLDDVGTAQLNNTQKTAIADLNVHGAMEVYLLCVTGNKRISDFEGGVAALSIPFPVPAGRQPSAFHALYVSDAGDIEQLATRYEDGKLHWDVGHFSDFVIVYDENKVNPDTGSDSSTKEALLTIARTVARIVTSYSSNAIPAKRIVGYDLFWYNENF